MIDVRFDVAEFYVAGWNVLTGQCEVIRLHAIVSLSQNTFHYISSSTGSKSLGLVNVV